MVQDPYRYFRIEAREVIAQLGTGVLALEKTGGDAELVSRLLRLSHTIKGAARIVKQREIADLAHQIEDALGPLRGHEVPPGRRDDMLALIDRMSTHLAALPEPPQPPPDAPARPRADDIALLPRTDTSSIDELIGALADIHAQINRLRTTPSLDALGPRVERLDRELRQVRLDAERLRLMPAGAVFGSLERAARDAALGGKHIVFAARGRDVRVDATVLMALHGALVQLVR
ncbi:MAG TPA: Hpt domain-containing protein, partial [Kofleriaceae bacterium]|nr:Hpt domain-containing protein [Kofleriaceae bacterium]